MTFKIETPSGPVELPVAQACAVAYYVEQIREDDGVALWHRNDCGCCVAVHAIGRDSGYVIGPDGGADFVELSPTGEIISRTPIDASDG